MNIAARIRAIVEDGEKGGAPRTDVGPVQGRESYRLFALAWYLRKHQPLPAECVAQLDALRHNENPQPSSPVRLLWHHWLLQLDQHSPQPPVERARLAALWSNAFRHQTSVGTLHPFTAETLLDAFVYDELCALHAAYNAAKLSGDPRMLEQVQRAVRWHVENTQPDHTTHEPWALAAFAELDDTGTFAEQQLHAAVAHLRHTDLAEASLLRALLADAEMTMRAFPLK
jgi:hypothetical protein